MFFKDFVSVKRKKIKKGASQTYDTPSFLQENKDRIWGLKKNKLKAYLNSQISAYDLAENGIESKATFAVEIIYNSEENGNKEFCGWNIPQYIKDGLLWIRK